MDYTECWVRVIDSYHKHNAFVFCVRLWCWWCEMTISDCRDACNANVLLQVICHEPFKTWVVGSSALMSNILTPIYRSPHFKLYIQNTSFTQQYGHVFNCMQNMYNDQQSYKSKIFHKTNLVHPQAGLYMLGQPNIVYEIRSNGFGLSCQIPFCAPAAHSWLRAP